MSNIDSKTCYNKNNNNIAIFFKNLKHLWFFIQICYVFFSEFAIYNLFNNYSTFIDRLTSKLASMNILYVKLFQAFALNNNFIDEETNNKLLRFTDNAPWDYTDIDFVTLLKITDEYNLHFVDGYEIPINSGMISLVFRAENKDTHEPLIVKLNRKNIEERLNDAMDDLLYCVDLLSFMPLFKTYKVSESIKKSTDMILEQTNFLIELDNMATVKNNCVNLKYVKIPYALEEVTKKYNNVIVMEYIDGLSINKIKKEDYEEFAKQVIKFGIATVAMHGVAHGDLHAGNILFIKDENDDEYPHKIGVLDFGIIYKLDNQYKETFFDIFTDLFTLTPKSICEKLFASGIIEPVEILQNLPKNHYDYIVNIGSDVIQNVIHTSKGANQVQVYKFLKEFSNFLKEPEIYNLGLKPSERFIKTQLILAMAHGITLTLCKDDCITIVDKVINEIFHCDLLEDNEE